MRVYGPACADFCRAHGKKRMHPAQNITSLICEYMDRHAPIFAVLMEKNGCIHYANAYAKDMCGEAIIGRNFRDLVIDFTGQFQMDHFHEMADPPRMIQVSAVNGLPRTLYFHFFDWGDQCLGVGKPDVSELEDLRHQLVALNNELNNITRQLQKSNAQLEQLNRLKNQFIGMAAHDLRKPVGLIMSYSEFLMEETRLLLNEAHQKFLRTIRSSAEFMRRLVDGFLDMAVIESGTLILDKTSVDLTHVLQQSLVLNEMIAKKKGVRIHVDHNGNIPWVKADSAKIEQVFTNLISNAVEHTPSGGHVFIKLYLQNHQVVASIQDQGPGIEKKDLDCLFKPFTPSQAQKSSGEKSIGLGLAISKKIIEAHGGKIWVESAYGKGATFYFSINM